MEGSTFIVELPGTSIIGDIPSLTILNPSLIAVVILSPQAFQHACMIIILIIILLLL